jgi:hypothetical protein
MTITLFPQTTVIGTLTIRIQMRLQRNPPAKAALRGRCSSGGSPQRLV